MELINQTTLPTDCEVLIVDDDEHVVMILGDYLEGRGARVVRATGGEQALALLASHPKIKLVLLDFAMPEMNGLTVLDNLNRIRQVEGRQLRIIFLTAQGSPKMALELLRKSVYLYMSKPVNLRELVKVLQDAYTDLVMSGMPVGAAKTQP